MIYRYDAVGVHLPPSLIVTYFKTLVREVKSDLVGSIGAGVVMERPAATLAMNETTVIVAFGVTRLDFTVIGPAVNMASRLETLTKQLGRTVLLSRAFADFVESDFDLERVDRG